MFLLLQDAEEDKKKLSTAHLNTLYTEEKKKEKLIHVNSTIDQILSFDKHNPHSHEPPKEEKKNLYLLHSQVKRLTEENYHLSNTVNPAKSRPSPNHVDCSICLTSSKDVLFQPCMHICCCSICAEKVSHCPVCRQSIQQKSKVFLS